VNGAEGQSGDQAAQEVTVELTVQNNSFSQEAISVPAGARVVMTFTNNDSRPHNFSLYRSPSALEAIFLGGIVSGPDQSVTYEFTAPSEPGEYYFQCDVHPYMNGTFTVEN
jgi:plastocyanin